MEPINNTTIQNAHFPPILDLLPFQHLLYVLEISQHTQNMTTKTDIQIDFLTCLFPAVGQRLIFSTTL